MSRLRKTASDDIAARIIEQLPAFAQDDGSAESYYDRLREMLRQEVDRCEGQELENLDKSVMTALEVVRNVQSALGLIETALENTEEDISDKR